MARILVPDDLWAAIAPLLPPEAPKPKGGRPWLPDRAALSGILFVLIDPAWAVLESSGGYPDPRP